MNTLCSEYTRLKIVSKFSESVTWSTLLQLCKDYEGTYLFLQMKYIRWRKFRAEFEQSDWLEELNTPIEYDLEIKKLDFDQACKFKKCSILRIV